MEPMKDVIHVINERKTKSKEACSGGRGRV